MGTYKPCEHDFGFTDGLHLPCGYESCEGNELQEAPSANNT